ncbi:MAG: tetratricopeptide repeat protein [Calditrichia bacterium]
MLRIISIFLLSFLFFISCATTKSDEGGGAVSEEDARQKELDEIEALLGVQRPPSDKDKKKKSAKEEDTLGLLSSEEIPVKSQQTATKKPQEKPASQQEVDRLKNQLAQKDAQISDLKQQVRNQNIQISQLESQGAPAMPVYGGTVGDVPPGEYQMRYQEGLDLFHGRNYKQAVEVFESLIASDGSNSLSDNAQYWIGESHYALGQYKKAVIDFEKVFTFPRSNKNPDAQFKLGLCYVRLGDSAKAGDEFQRLIDVYPESSYVGRAQEHLAGL